MTPDVNVLVAASRTDHPHHEVAKAWLEGALAATGAGQRFLLLPTVAAGFLRLVTHPRVMEEPTPLPDALTFIGAIRRAPGVEWVALGPEWDVLERLCAEGDLHGNRIPDGWIAAAVLVHGDHLATFDRGFRALLPASQLTLLDPSPPTL